MLPAGPGFAAGCKAGARALTGAVSLAVILQGCARPAAPPPQGAQVPPPPHAGPPPAVTCTVVPFAVRTGGTADVQMVVSHEGGYCAAALMADNGQAYDAGLVHVAPLHGVPRVIHYNGKTSIEYAPQPGFIGHDNFQARLIVRGHSGYTTLNVSVSVQ